MLDVGVILSSLLLGGVGTAALAHITGPLIADRLDCLGEKNSSGLGDGVPLQQEGRLLVLHAAKKGARLNEDCSGLLGVGFFTCKGDIALWSDKKFRGMPRYSASSAHCSFRKQ
jgi:hypothetical protein